MLNMRLLDVSVTYFTETLNNFYSNTRARVCETACVGPPMANVSPAATFGTMKKPPVNRNAERRGLCCTGVAVSAVQC